MRRTVRVNKRRLTARAVAAVCLSACLSVCMGGALQAEEQSGYYDEWGNWIEGSAYPDDSYFGEAGLENTDALAALTDGFSQDSANAPADMASSDFADASLLGTYSVAEGWSVDSDASTSEKTVYKMDSCLELEDTSTIACSYMDTNYSVLEYEQLRDMLTNNLLYANVNAQISTSAIYTQAKDYLYIVIVDDSALEYKDIYHYVVGDYRCFCVEVREYRGEADQAVAEGVKTPREVGQTTAEEFTWS